jgi:hypothetical protein
MSSAKTERAQPPARTRPVKVEYLYVDLGSRQMFNIVPSVPETVSFTANIVRAAFNYKFY